MQNNPPAQLTFNQPHPALPSTLPSFHRYPHLPLYGTHTAQVPTVSPTDAVKKRVGDWLSRVEASTGRSFTPRTRQSRKYTPYASPHKLLPAASNSSLLLNLALKPEPSDGEVDMLGSSSDDTHSIPPIDPECDGTPMFGNCDPPIFDVYDLEYLPDPVSNPLITTNPIEIKEEIHRLKIHSMHLQREKEESDQKWLQFKSPETLTEFLKLSASFAKVEAALRYVICYTRQHNIPIDLEELSYRYTRNMMKKYGNDD
ncbi:hypothetical protein CVT24_009314 [Panaeolus cyanescens]|uniref:Uncharacterized protein n=1 Tax=Panaeolus cyanescens TaxID=181874 RepID=A0A409Y8H3_9AGAR|nr:hypothetical protein CVT24_009314 [Panaeolus cyanescens]